MADLGVSFIPSGDESNGQQMPGGAAPGVPPLQSAIRLLSMRLPRFGGGMSPGGIAPGALLGSQGAGGLGAAGGGLEAMLRALFGLGGPAQGPMGAPPSAPMLPKIIPGDLDRTMAPGDGTLPGGFKPQPTFQPSAPAPTMTAPTPRMPRYQQY
jgi:hypothetical protein